jgi:carboxyl-terminal processing protease
VQPPPRSIATTILLLASLFVSNLSFAEEEPLRLVPEPSTAELQLTVKRLLSKLDGLEPGSVWPVATEIARLGAAAAPLVAAQLENAGEVPRLALAKALCAMGEPGLGGRTLLETARVGSTSDVRTYAARAIGITQELVGFDPVAEALSMILDEESEPIARGAICDAILKITAYPGNRFVSFNKSADESKLTPRQKAVKELQVLAAGNAAAAREAVLALGENGMPHLVKTQLMEIAGEPTAEGMRARLTLRKARPEWVDLLDEITTKIQDAYVREDSVDKKALISAAAKGMATSLDDFCDYLTEDDVEDMDAMITGSYQGIGAWVGIRDGVFTIVSPVYDGPAYRAGIRSQDRIIEVDGLSTSDIGFEKTVKHLKGLKGTAVKVKVMRRGWSEPQPFTIVREEIRIRNSYTQMLPGNIAYIKLTRFGDKSGEEMRKSAADFVGRGAKAIVLDLRNNGGGLLSAAVEVSDVFLGPDRVIVYSQGRDEIAPLRRYFSTEKFDDDVNDCPMAVLVNSGTASASEIVSGALQDWGRARIVGEKTFGKGSVQSLIPLRSTGWKTKLRLTIAKYYLPSGRCIDKLGIDPDIAMQDEMISGWESEQIAKQGLVERIDALIDSEYKRDPTAFKAIAESDGKNLASYPGMHVMREELDKRISGESLRLIARASVRRRVADKRGSQFITDLQDDRVLRRGVYEVLTQGMDLADMPPVCQEILEEFANEKPAPNKQAAAD